MCFLGTIVRRDAKRVKFRVGILLKLKLLQNNNWVLLTLLKNFKNFQLTAKNIQNLTFLLLIFNSVVLKVHVLMMSTIWNPKSNWQFLTSAASPCHFKSIQAHFGIKFNRLRGQKQCSRKTTKRQQNSKLCQTFRLALVDLEFH